MIEMRLTARIARSPGLKLPRVRGFCSRACARPGWRQFHMHEQYNIGNYARALGQIPLRPVRFQTARLAVLSGGGGHHAYRKVVRVKAHGPIVWASAYWPTSDQDVDPRGRLLRRWLLIASY